MFYLPLITAIFIQNLLSVNSFSLDERNAIVRKFKYYHKSVRPNNILNRVSTANGSFFALNSELHILSTIPTKGDLLVDFYFTLKYVDDRLILRELQNRFQLPSDFRPWVPTINIYPKLSSFQSIFVDPTKGILTVARRFQTSLVCSSDEWRHPFETYRCFVAFSLDGDERIFLQTFRDLRSEHQKSKVHCKIDQWPQFEIRFSYVHQWYLSLITSHLPSFLLFLTSLFAQWKRKMIQVFVTTSALLAIVIMETSYRTIDTLTLGDLWLSVTFLHIVCMLCVDLLLSTERVRFTEKVGNLDSDPRAITINGSSSTISSRPFMVTQRVAPDGSIHSSIETQLVTTEKVTERLPPPVTTLRQHQTSIAAGRRKAFALSTIVIFYIAFVSTYIYIVIMFW
ncbi:hypothetical protein AB6A40_000910 [Gnathostoma spinigerum]|uniref:Transmembrane ion channel n=1 Tax=Gnathostoma spinigerum TaxID=75299 RepID=A0ABD6E9W8_9BILA